jgi:uncharacterized membrane protein
MVLDHTRDFIGSSAISPTDLSKTNTLLFFTRWLTHFCAPAFVFLAGVSARLLATRLPTSELRRFLVARGLWLILLEVTVVNFAWSFNLQYRMGLVLQVIWAIGASMCVLGLLTWLNERVLLALGLLLVAGHNLLDAIEPQQLGAWAPLWNVLHVKGPTPFGVVLYPLLPWLGTMLLGYAAGRIFQLPTAERRTLLLRLGAAACLLFVVIRGLNGYGDSTPWLPQASGWFTLLSFLNVSKYPPSLDYVLMTLGPILIALSLVERFQGPLARTLRTAGQVPLFAYVLHLFLVHGLAGLLGLVSGHGKSMFVSIFVFYPKDWGYELGPVYLSWLLVLALLIPACRWFAHIKRTNKSRLLSYL